MLTSLELKSVKDAAEAVRFITNWVLLELCPNDEWFFTLY